MLIRLLNLLDQEKVKVEARLLAETRKAVKVERDGRAAWMPKAWLLRRRDLGGERQRSKWQL